MTALSFLASLGWAASAHIQTAPLPLHMTVYLNGGAVGENSFARQADGAFNSETTLTIGTIKIVSKVAGHFRAGLLSDYASEQTRDGATVKLTLKDGKLTVVPPNGKPTDAPYDKSVKTYFGNLHPGLTSSLLKAVDWNNKQTQSIRAYLIDSGAALNPKVTPLDEKSTPAGKVRRYQAEFGGVTAEYSMTEDERVVGMNVPGQKLRFVADGWNALYEDPFSKYPELSPSSHKVRQLPTQKMKTRDGVELVQDVYLPEEVGRYPVVFVRTPYDRRTEALTADFYAKRGYAYVVQDCRGRTDSSGAWNPFVNEINDGYDSIDWIAKQPWCDGKVGMIGGSYGGFVQWAAAASHHPALKCIIPQVSPPLDAMHNLPYDNGVFFLYGDIWWGKVVREKKSDMSSIQSTLPNPKGFLTLPLSKADDSVLGHNVPFYDEWLEKDGLDKWKGWNFYKELDTVTVPALHISGWWDGDEIGTNMNWDKMRQLGRKNQWLIYGPWTHFFNSSTKLGDTDYGQKAMIDLDTLYIRWFDTWLKGKDVGLEKIPHVQAFVTGANKWLSLPDWPNPMSTTRTLYLSAPQKANGLKGKGRLVAVPAVGQKPSEYTYDPSKDTVPPSILDVDPSKASTKIEGQANRNDMLMFVGDRLPHATAISGPITVDLKFKTSARDTDFYVVLVDMDEKGAYRVFGQTGKLRCSYIGGFDRPRPLTPNRIYTATIRPWDTAHQLPAGHRLGLMISSSAFPLYARNLGTGEPIKNATRMVPQKNTIFHDTINPSKVTFRVFWE